MTRIWDPIVRIFHWALVVAVAVAWLTGEDSGWLHTNAGYVVAGLVAARLVWGVVGSHYARFAQFLRAPGTVADYLRDMAAGRERRYLGHNPAGAVMIVLLLAVLAGTAWTGWLMENPARIAALSGMPHVVAPAFADDDGDEHSGGGDGSEAVEELHELLANGLLVLIAVHVGGVILASWRHRENLARAMVTGDKRAAAEGDIA